ncbi:MAG: hypothetical protein UR28_C0038G0007 [Candidatus Peregrinibacteria bacterium GW2011_GWF2_33_10]|nr:MAG: hypothetical protein UR28_C0038G0007 [Candidatus Peregrinibacteria bacterium GW2011_GWF2_33_10]OGJ45483.1 MAG: hypothetical protein A2263_00235 [Candidatus Peregrinibacteria bacterium RIFOXYA2_FULL_33_21]OGJ51188.1 MAG: hypothetical protein A2307_05270 [Candidatus Peregrinibacteria bacterium RIFOXYB2_FULL_33_20]
MQKKIEFVYLKNTSAISLSGNFCALNCKHCNKHYLKHMKTINDNLPSNTRSVLISGGLDKEGKSFIKKFAKNLLELKKSHHYKFNAHIGFPDENEIDEIKNIIDVVSFDLISDEKVVKKVYGLHKNKEDYINLYKILKAKKIPVHPHITIGIDEGKIHWEYEAIDILKKLNADKLVLNVFIPTKGTVFENAAKPDLDEIRKVFKYARKIFKNKILILGCMRPYGQYRADLDKIAVEENFDRIVHPTLMARRLVEEKNFEIKYLYECCVMD